MVKVETLGHSQSKYKNCLGVEILGTRPPPWAWDATSVPYPLGNMHGLGSCKRSWRNWLIPSKPHFLNFSQYVAWAWAILKRIKYNVIHELSPQRSRAWLNQACRKCVAKMDINTLQTSHDCIVEALLAIILKFWLFFYFADQNGTFPLLK